MTLQPSDRRQLAQDLCERLVTHYPDQVLLAGVYGSTARRVDTPWSDLELLFVVRDGCPAQGQHLLFQGTVLGYRVYRQAELEEVLRTPSRRWPFHMGLLSSLEVLYGDERRVAGWLALGKAVPQAAFLQALEALLPELVFEAQGRVHSCLARGQQADLIPTALEVLFEMRTALCLLNQAWTTHDYGQGLADSFQFDRLPEGYARLASALYRARDPQEIVALVDDLVSAYTQLLDREGVVLRDYQLVKEIPV